MRGQASRFAEWTQFCADHDLPTTLSGIDCHETRLCHLLVFGWRLRQRRSGRTGKPIRARTVSAALQAVGKGISQLGQPDPRFIAPGSKLLHPLLQDFLRALERDDDPASRAHPANITILQRLGTTLDLAESGPRHTYLLCIVGFFWLLRPAEYLSGTGETRSQSFRLCDVTFVVDGSVIAAADASLNDLDLNRLERASLTFNDQKNAVRGEQITHAATTDPHLCPCKSLARICEHLRQHHADATTPLHTYYDADGNPSCVTPQQVTDALRTAAAAVEAQTGIPPTNLSARSLRPGGATALLCSGIHSTVIQLIGRWRSDAMLLYLRVAALASTTNLAQRMLVAGAYTFDPGACAADNPQPVPTQAPRDFITALERANLYQR